jgi:hypothetical protein
MFWNSPWPDKAFQKQMRESRKIEDLILPFVTTATKSLKKEEELADGAWKFELNTQIALFLDLLADSLAAVGPSSGELTNRLESYRQTRRVLSVHGVPKRTVLEGKRRRKSVNCSVYRTISCKLN